MIIKILGPGCANCANLEKAAREAVAGLGLEATFEKVTDYPTIAGYGVMSTPDWSSTRRSSSPAGCRPPPRSASSWPR
ncbi:thioredoxin family protein [Cellulomonas soli]